MMQEYITKEPSILILESVRAGIPSRESIAILPDIRAEQIRQIDLDLAELNEGKSIKGRILWGEYGQGKTHFLKQAEKHILSQGYAVSYLSLSPDLSLNRMDTFFPALAARVLTDDSQIPGLLNQILSPDSLSHRDEQLYESAFRIRHPLPLMIYNNISQGDPTDLNILYNALMGKKENFSAAKNLVKRFRLKEYRTMPKFRQKDSYLSFVEFFPLLIQNLGYKGWVILIDELEIIGRMGSVSRLNCYKNLAWLLNMGKAHNFPLYTLAAAAKSLQTDVFFGAKKRDAEDMAAFAEKRGDDEGKSIIQELFAQITKKRNLMLKQEEPEKLIPLLEKLLILHQNAITWKHELPENFIPDTLKRISPQAKPIRQVIRMFIETLDIYAAHGIIPGKFVENLMEAYDYDTPVEEPNEAEPAPMGFTETPLKDMFDS